MIVPTNHKSIRFTDDKIMQVLRVGIDRDVLRSANAHVIVMNDVPFGIANRILNVTSIDVNVTEENWVKVVCGDDETLKRLYTDTVASKVEPSVVITEEPKVEDEPIVVEEQPTVEIPVQQDEPAVVSVDEDDSAEDTTIEEPTATVVEDESNDEPVAEDSDSYDEDITDEESEATEEESNDEDSTMEEETASTDEPVQATEPTVKPVENVRRQVNINNNRRHKHH